MKTVQEFASDIKTLHPLYKDIDDEKLARDWVAKFPRYAEVVNFNEKSTLDKGLEVAKTIGENLPGVVIAREVGKAGKKFATGMRSSDKPDSQDMLERGGQKTVRKIKSMEPAVGAGGGPAKEAGKIAVAGAMETGRQILEDVTPETTAGAMATVAAGPIEEVGKTALGELPVVGKFLKADLSEIPAELHRFLSPPKEVAKAPMAPPVSYPKDLSIPKENPLTSMIEEEKKYEMALAQKAVLNGNPKYEPFMPELKANFSQLREARTGSGSAGPERPLGQLAGKEFSMETEKIIEGMPQGRKGFLDTSQRELSKEGKLPFMEGSPSPEISTSKKPIYEPQKGITKVEKPKTDIQGVVSDLKITPPKPEIWTGPMREKPMKLILKDMSDSLGEKGAIGNLGEADGAKYVKLRDNTREMMRRAVGLGYESAEEILAFAARQNAPKELIAAMEKELKGRVLERPSLDPQPLNEVIKAQTGSKIAKDTIYERIADRWRPDGRASKIRSLLQLRHGDIAERSLDSDFFIRQATQKLSLEEREALPFNGVAPKESAFNWHPRSKRIMQLIEKPTPEMKAAMAKIRPYMDEAHGLLSEHFDDVGYVQDYVTQLWDRPHDVVLNRKTGLGIDNPFTKERSYPNYAEGINDGLRPKNLDMSQILKSYDSYKIKTVANIKFLEELKTMPTPEGHPAVMNEFETVTKDGREFQRRLAPVGWVKSDIPAFRGKMIHPLYADAVKLITNYKADVPVLNEITKAYDFVGEAIKHVSFMASPFHYGSLFTVGTFASDVPLKIPLKVLSMTGKYVMKEALADDSEKAFATKLFNAFKNGHAAFADMPLAKDALKAGVELGPLPDAFVGGMQGYARTLESKLNRFYLDKGIRAIRTTDEVINKPLWDYFHAGSKMLMYQENLLDAMKSNMKLPPDKQLPLPILKQRVARFVNDAGGGQAWETLGIAPQMRRAIQRAFFTPDWMASRARSLGTVLKVGTPEGKLSQKFWLRAGVAFMTIANWENIVNTKKYLPEARTIFKNDPGKELSVFVKNDEKGRAIYKNIAPALTEPFMWILDPKKAINSRFSPTIALMTEFFGGFTPSGYKIPEDQRGFSDLMKRHFTPIQFKGSNELGLFPMSKGISQYDVVKRLEGFIKNGDDPEVALKYGAENGYNMQKLYAIAKGNVKSRMRKELSNE